jgi:hypothetical protein
MKQHFDILGVWFLSIATFLTSSEVIGFFAIAASITTIIGNLPGVIKFIKKYIKNEK